MTWYILWRFGSHSFHPISKRLKVHLFRYDKPLNNSMYTSTYILGVNRRQRNRWTLLSTRKGLELVASIEIFCIGDKCSFIMNSLRVGSTSLRSPPYTLMYIGTYSSPARIIYIVKSISQDKLDNKFQTLLFISSSIEPP